MSDPLSPLDGPGPDLMNDPQYATNTSDGDDGMGEADTCRICRGEGADSESLFHPCKCSGSIKYVHQDCLMEWLSHSQKKHCELCKTPFRFTKLYSPNMPQSLPFHLLVRHIFIHILKNLGTWLRFALVVFVWLGCLPYAIRQVWRLLFWFSDGGRPANYSVELDQPGSVAANQTLEALHDLLHKQAFGNATSPVTPPFPAQTTPASLGGIIDKLTQAVTPLAHMLNVSSSDLLVGGFFKSLFSGSPAQDLAPHQDIQNLSTVSPSYGETIPALTPTLLSEVQFLKTLTRNSHLNQLVISVVEGYVITILVVVCFILIFLIREWVVQQQPGINMGAGFNAEFAPAERPPREQNAAVNAHADFRDIDNRRIARPRRRLNLAEETDDEMPDLLFDNPLQTPEPDFQGDIAGQNRPSPVRDALSPAAEIQRRLTEEPRFTEDFLTIWRRAEGNPEEVLRIIEDENRGEEMRYWVNSMRLLQHPSRRGSSQESQNSSLPVSDETIVSQEDTPSEPRGLTASRSFDSLRAHATESDKGSVNSENWISIPESVSQPEIIPRSGFQESVPTDRKGKGRAVDESHNPSWPAIFSSSSGTRPRAISDGPQPVQGISPLANNNWSFANLPDTAENMELRLPRERIIQSSENPSPSLFSPSLEQLSSSQEESNTNFHDTWRKARALRVQQAIEKGSETQKSNQGQQTPHAASENQSEDGQPIEIIGVDGTVRTVQNWDEEFENHPIEESDSEIEDHTSIVGTEVNPFAEDTPLPASQETFVVAPVPEPRGLAGTVADFLWGGVGDVAHPPEEGGDVEHIVQDLANEAPFVPVVPFDNFDPDDDDVPAEDRDVVDAAIAAGIDPNDPDAIDDAEDFEGIMELVGMRGPVFSLFQNAIFSAFLLALTVGFGVWIPYNIGRVSLLLAANPGSAFKLPLKLIFVCAAFVQDLALSLLGVMSYILCAIIAIPLRLFSNVGSNAYDLGLTALQHSQDALQRISNGIVDTLVHFSESDIFAFSAASHESLINLRTLTVDTVTGVGSSIAYLFTGNYTVTPAQSLAATKIVVHNATEIIRAVPSVLAKPETWVISLEVPKRAFPLDLALGMWSGTDRFWAVVVGYTTLCVAGALYVRKGTPFSSGQAGREWEATAIDLLNQAGGVLKVILIISIEMLVFPLYCGLLLDAALLPLFDNATMMTRFQFTRKSPLTSIFVHWFVGTCYMFHFALFVSMCRKIMRKGVLYFIRDPDDPTFHPVRDVLERNVATQLRKILFSALVYGALVVICLGGVVWGLALACRGVLPIHWSSNEPVMEFPIDLLFYNFLMPLAVRFFKPSDALHSMYSWWFRRCARMLRLTWFMFDERKIDEEGYYVRRSWTGIFRGANGDPETIIENDNIYAPFAEDPDLDVYFRRDGRYVRAPASDQVRIPKGSKIFLQVDAENKRIDNEIDQPDGVHGSNNRLYKHLYVPPHFQLRIFTFIFSIWVFAALTGVSITVVPLVFGRYIFAKMIPPHVRKNDVYAFSIGIYILGSVLYAVLHLRTFIKYVEESFAVTAATPTNILNRVASMLSLITRIAWTYTAFLFILPTLFAAVVELYFIVPMHTYFSLEEQHVVHFVQSWTLGLLYVKLTTRIILWHENSRQAQSLRAITRNGYFNPDAKLATRCFILPAGLFLSFVLAVPWGVARLFTATMLKERPEAHIMFYRYAYPVSFGLACAALALYALVGMLKRWRMMIRDEVYLIGERLHNFGDRKATVVAAPSLRRIET